MKLGDISKWFDDNLDKGLHEQRFASFVQNQFPDMLDSKEMLGVKQEAWNFYYKCYSAASDALRKL